MNTRSTKKELLVEIEELRARLEEAEDTLCAIRQGEVDALLVSGPTGEQVFTLESAEQPYRILIEQMQEGAVTLAADGTILYCNLRFARMLKVPHEKIVASPAASYVAPEQAEPFVSLLHTGSRQSARAEITLIKGDGVSFPTYITVSPLPVEVEGCICMIVTDLTEQESMRRSQAEIGQLNERLKRSMTETHHRVKNSLQIIGAMVDLQIMEDNESVSIEELRRLSTHIKSLAVVHDLLTAEAKTDGQAYFVSGRAVLEKLLFLLRQTAAGRQFQIQVADARLSSGQATGLALITNEIISNALKHGQGVVEVTFEIHDAMAILEVCDDGPGFPPHFNPHTLSTTGIGLIENLSRWDLGGNAQYQNRPQGGAKVTINMPLAVHSLPD